MHVLTLGLLWSTCLGSAGAGSSYQPDTIRTCSELRCYRSVLKEGMQAASHQPTLALRSSCMATLMHVTVSCPVLCHAAPCSCTFCQSALSKERRELQQQQQRTLLEAIPKDLSRPWEDPMPEEGERHLAAVGAQELEQHLLSQ
jgi:hypothetical protein